MTTPYRQKIIRGGLAMPWSAITFTSGTNLQIAEPNTPLVVVTMTGTPGACSFDGIIPGPVSNGPADGIYHEFMFNFKQQVTIVDASVTGSSYPFYTPTGANVVLALPGRFNWMRCFWNQSIVGWIVLGHS
jgi:hypothetical protein